MARSEVANDAFTTELNATNWDNGPADFETWAWNSASGGVIRPVTSDGADDAIRRQVGTYSNDQYSIVTIQTHAQGSGNLTQIDAGVRMTDSATDESCYVAQAVSVNSYAIGHAYAITEYDSSGVATELATAGSAHDLSAGDTVVLEVVGSDLEMFTDEGGGEVSRVTTTDATISSGWPGVVGYTEDVTNCQVTAWSGGDITSGLSIPVAYHHQRMLTR